MRNVWEEQQKTIERIREENPSLLERTSSPDPDLVLSQIGILGLDADRPRGYLFYRPEDMCIEERCTDGSVCSVQPTRSVPDRYDGGNVLHGNLIKKGCSMQEALDRLAEAFGVDRACIRHAGAKDRRGWTSQRVSIEGVSWERVAKKPIAPAFAPSELRTGRRPDPTFAFEPVAYERAHVSSDDVVGDRLTMFVRHDGSEEVEKLKFLIDVYGEHGFLNFAAPCAFGSRRINHKLGCLLLRGDIDGVLRTFFVQPGADDIPLYRQVRERLAASYGDWRAMREIVSPLPYAFAAELRVLKALEAEPKKTRGALRTISRDLDRFVRAYGAWLFNRTLSRSLVSLCPVSDGLPMRPDPAYHSLLEEDGVMDFEGEAKRMGIRLAAEMRPTRVRPDVHHVIRKDAGTQFTFSLPKNADHHAFLSHLYRLHEGLPVPGWVRG